jgi:hypothetical protein
MIVLIEIPIIKTQINVILLKLYINLPTIPTKDFIENPTQNLTLHVFLCNEKILGVSF